MLALGIGMRRTVDLRRTIILAAVFGLLSASQSAAQTPPSDAQRAAMLARAKALEISNAWTPPPRRSDHTFYGRVCQVVRVGRYAGTRPADASLNRSLALLMTLVPANR